MFFLLESAQEPVRLQWSLMGISLKWKCVFYLSQKDTTGSAVLEIAESLGWRSEAKGQVTSAFSEVQ